VKITPLEARLVGRITLCSSSPRINHQLDMRAFVSAGVASQIYSTIFNSLNCFTILSNIPNGKAAAIGASHAWSLLHMTGVGFFLNRSCATNFAHVLNLKLCSFASILSLHLVSIHQIRFVLIKHGFQFSQLHRASRKLHKTQPNHG
jgi:hypothetical protein